MALHFIQPDGRVSISKDGLPQDGFPTMTICTTTMRTTRKIYTCLQCSFDTIGSGSICTNLPTEGMLFPGQPRLCLASFAVSLQILPRELLAVSNVASAPTDLPVWLKRQ